LDEPWWITVWMHHARYHTRLTHIASVTRSRGHGAYKLS
jgi:hypothetical protein